MGSSPGACIAISKWIRLPTAKVDLSRPPRVAGEASEHGGGVVDGVEQEMGLRFLEMRCMRWSRTAAGHPLQAIERYCKGLVAVWL